MFQGLPFNPFKIKREIEELESKKRGVVFDFLDSDYINHLKFQLQFSWQFWTLLISIIILSVNVGVFFHSVRIDEKINRPYLSLIDSSLEYTDPAIESKNFNQLRFETYITNIGNLPAKFKVINAWHDGYDKIFWTLEEPADGVIFPGQKIRVSWILSWNKESEDFLKWVKEEMNPTFLFEVEKVRMKIDYATLGSNNYSYFSELQSELTRVRNGKIGTSEFSWKITNAK